MSQRLKTKCSDRPVSALCFRGSHQGSGQKHVCKGRNCSCDCHPINEKMPFCIVCNERRTDNDSQICRYCTGEVSNCH